MHIQYTTQGHIESALYWINTYFDQNIEFGKFIEVDFQYFIVTLRVIDINKVGHCITRIKPHVKLPTACSHVHRAFLLELPDEASIFDGQHWWMRADGEFPTTHSKHICECEESVMSYVPKRIRRNNY